MRRAFIVGIIGVLLLAGASLPVSAASAPNATYTGNVSKVGTSVGNGYTSHINFTGPTTAAPTSASVKFNGVDNAKWDNRSGSLAPAAGATHANSSVIFGGNAAPTGNGTSNDPVVVISSPSNVKDLTLYSNQTGTTLATLTSITNGTTVSTALTGLNYTDSNIEWNVTPYNSSLATSWSWNLYTKLHTISNDPSITINGHTVSVNGTFPSGTNGISVVNSSFFSQDNTIGVSVSNSSLISNSPPMTVSYRLNFTAHTTQVVSSSSTEYQWIQKFPTFTHTFGANETGMSLSLVVSSKAHGVNVVKMNNGSGYTTMPSTFYGTNHTIVTHVGSVSAGESVSTRERAQLVSVSGGSIRVTRPTAVGSSLDTRFNVTSGTPVIDLHARNPGRHIVYTTGNGTSMYQMGSGIHKLTVTLNNGTMVTAHEMAYTTASPTIGTVSIGRIQYNTTWTKLKFSGQTFAVHINNMDGKNNATIGPNVTKIGLTNATVGDKNPDLMWAGVNGTRSTLVINGLQPNKEMTGISMSSGKVLFQSRVNANGTLEVSPHNSQHLVRFNYGMGINAGPYTMNPIYNSINMNTGQIKNGSFSLQNNENQSYTVNVTSSSPNVRVNASTLTVPANGKITIPYKVYPGSRGSHSYTIDVTGHGVTTKYTLDVNVAYPPTIAIGGHGKIKIPILSIYIGYTPLTLGAALIAILIAGGYIYLRPGRNKKMQYR